MLLFQDDDDEEEVPLVRKRKQPSASISHQSEGGPSTKEAKVEEANKKKKKQNPIVQEVAKKDQGEKEEARPVVIVRENSAIKKTKVHKALKIHTSSDSGEITKPKENPAPEKETLVEKDQNNNVVEDKVPGLKENPLPQPEPLVQDPNATNEGKQDNLQDAPNSEQKNDPLTNPEVENKVVYFILFSNFISSSTHPLV
jgi:hypothetical protein